VYEETDFDSNHKELKKGRGKNPWKWFLLLFLVFLIPFLIYISYVYGLFNFMTTGKISPASELKNLVWAGKLDGENDGDINVLFLGMRGDEEVEPYITNAMMVMNIDTKTKRINLISVPRDLWISIPGYGNSKVNSVYKIARYNNNNNDYQNLEFSKNVFREFLGIDIQYAFLLDFSGFEEMIDDIGQVEISMTEEEASNYPFLQEKNFRDALVAGSNATYRLNGEQSLIFIRWPENAVPDFDRIRRQHLFLYSLRNQYLNYNVLLNPKKPIRLIRASSKNIKTDLNLWEILKFTEITNEINMNNISKHYLNINSETDGGLLSESKINNGLIYLPRAGRNDFSEIKNWAKKVVDN
jgi:LCP family protein required for cell wall assembly